MSQTQVVKETCQWDITSMSGMLRVVRMSSAWGSGGHHQPQRPPPRSRTTSDRCRQQHPHRLDHPASGTLTVMSRAVGRGWPADLGQDSGGVGLGGRLDQARDDHLLKGSVTPDRLTQPQTGVDRLDGLDQPA